MPHDSITQEQFKQLNNTVVEIRDALLGSMDGKQIGLIEQSRSMQGEINDMKSVQQQLLDDVATLKSFRNRLRWTVLLVSSTIAVAWEVGKTIVTAWWEGKTNGSNH